MRSDIFIPTTNFQRMQALCEELLRDTLGVEMAAIMGRAGRGKTTAAFRIFAMNPATVYVLYHEDWSHNELMREIAFRLCGTRPRLRQTCFEMIRDELSARRRIVMIDEADRMNIKCLNVMRNLHDVCHVPVLFIGEEDLSARLSRERRLISRVRDMVTFTPATQADCSVFYSEAMNQRLAPEHAARLIRHSDGDFRRILTDALYTERILKASNLQVITDKVIDEICKK